MSQASTSTGQVTGQSSTGVARPRLNVKSTWDSWLATGDNQGKFNDLILSHSWTTYQDVVDALKIPLRSRSLSKLMRSDSALQALLLASKEKRKPSSRRWVSWIDREENKSRIVKYLTARDWISFPDIIQTLKIPTTPRHVSEFIDADPSLRELLEECQERSARPTAELNSWISNEDNLSKLEKFISDDEWTSYQHVVTSLNVPIASGGLAAYINQNPSLRALVKDSRAFPGSTSFAPYHHPSMEKFRDKVCRGWDHLKITAHYRLNRQTVFSRWKACEERFRIQYQASYCPGTKGSRTSSSNHRSEMVDEGLYTVTDTDATDSNGQLKPQEALFEIDDSWNFSNSSTEDRLEYTTPPRTSYEGYELEDDGPQNIASQADREARLPSIPPECLMIAVEGEHHSRTLEFDANVPDESTSQEGLYERLKILQELPQESLI